jgi:hypothetical protein
MLRNYLKVAIRVLQRNRLISFINIFGLGLSMSVAMMIMIRIQDQMNFDRFHPTRTELSGSSAITKRKPASIGKWQAHRYHYTIN